MKPVREMVNEIKQERKVSDRKRQVLYLSDSLLKIVRAEYPDIPVSRLIEKFLCELIQDRKKK